MTTPPKKLSPERCNQLREGGIFRVLTNLLHEHTFELPNKPEADFNIEMFLMDFNRKAELRDRTSQQVRTIVEHTAKNEYELEILGMLETLRKYIEQLYNYIVGWKAMTEDPSKLRECSDQLFKLAGQVKRAFEALETLTAFDTTRRIFEQFGGVFVIVDFLRAQTRFNTKCLQFEPDQIDKSQFLGFAKALLMHQSKLALRDAVAILYKLVVAIDSSKDIRLFLGNCRSLHEIMVGIVKDAYDDGRFDFVKVYCCLLFGLYSTDNLVVPAGVRLPTFHLKDCGVIQCLAKFGMETKDPQSLCYVLMALGCPLALDRQNALEFVSIDGAVDMLIDVLVPSKEKDEDVENAESYMKQRRFSTSALLFINRHLFTQDRIDGRLLTIYESRDFAALLVHHLELITSINEYSLTTEGVLSLLEGILVSSEDQRRKFTGIVNGKEVVKRFESSENEAFADFSKWIGEMFE